MLSIEIYLRYNFLKLIDIAQEVESCLYSDKEFIVGVYVDVKLLTEFLY